jgi:plastocyanin
MRRTGRCRTTSRDAVGGVAIFDDFRVTRAGKVRVVASATNVAPASSRAFLVNPQIPTNIALVSVPSMVVAGERFAVITQTTDEFGNVSGGNEVAIELSTTSGAPLRGTTKTVANTTTTVWLERAGEESLVARIVGSTTQKTSSTVVVRPAAPDSLVIPSFPTTAVAAATYLPRALSLLPPVEIEVVDQYNNRVTDATIPISLYLATGPSWTLLPPGTLIGTTTRVPSNGVARFDDLEITTGGSYSLVAASNGSYWKTSPVAIVVSHSIVVLSDRYAPASVTVKPGETVQWYFAAAGHSVTSDGLFDSGAPATVGDTFRYLFRAVDTVGFYSRANPSMTGTVRVTLE